MRRSARKKYKQARERAKSMVEAADARWEKLWASRALVAELHRQRKCMPVSLGSLRMLLLASLPKKLRTKSCSKMLDPQTHFGAYNSRE